MSLGGFTRGLAAGVAVMYLLDPIGGRRRRAALRDRVIHALNTSEQTGGRVARDTANRARGLAAAATSHVRRPGHADAPVIEARVRSAIGRIVTHPRSIDVSAERGTVVLSGLVLPGEAAALIAKVRSVRGVTDIVNHLEVCEAPERFAGVSAGPPERVRRTRTSMSPAGRLLTGTGGIITALYGGRLPFPLRQPLRMIGMGLLVRAITNRSSSTLPGAGRQRGGVHAHKTIRVDAPVDEVYRFWRAFENFPRFMSHVREVHLTGELTSHWVAEGPGGTMFDWSATITDLRANRRIAWRSDAGAHVPNAGVVRFEPVPGGATRVHVRLLYFPPAGMFGHGIAVLFGKDPRQALNDDLMRFKSLMEEGRTRAHGTEVLREELEPAAPSTVEPDGSAVDDRFGPMVTSSGAHGPHAQWRAPDRATTEAMVDETLRQTFPASDPPAWCLGTELHAGPPVSEQTVRAPGG